MKAGVGGAENAWPDAVEALPAIPNLGSCEDVDGRFEPDVFTERFFILRIFLFGESDRSIPGRVGKELENWSLPSIIPSAE